jgi:Domain of unknown function (DUF4384)
MHRNFAMASAGRRAREPGRTWGGRSGVLPAMVLVVASCGGGGSEARPAATAGAASCDGQAREPLNCDTEVQYQATDAKLTFSGWGVNAQGGVEQKALRQIDDQTAMYVAESRRLCDEYNKCVLDRATYATRSENLRRRISKVPELAEEVKRASDDDARRAALAKAYREMVPDDARTELRLNFSVLAQRPGEAAMQAVAQGAVLPTGSHVAFVVHVSRPAHVYVFEKSAQGSVDVLFPDPRIALSNPIGADALRIPQGGASFKLDDKDIGTEAVYIVASLKPVTKLQEAAARAASGPRAPGGDGVLGRVASIDPKCRTRGFSLEEDAPSGGCSRSRGLSLDAAGPSSPAAFQGAPGVPGAASLTTVTEAADDTIATVFRFEHTRS